MSSQTRPSGVKNTNIPIIILTFARNRRLRRECCLKIVLEHPRAPNRWRRNPQEHPKGNQESPKRDTEQPRAPEVKPREPEEHPEGSQESHRELQGKFCQKTEMTEVKIVLPLGRGHDFRCQRRGEGRTSFRFFFGAPAGPLKIPWVLRCAQKTLTMMNSICLETIYWFSSRLISVKALRAGRFTPCEPSSGGF